MGVRRTLGVLFAVSLAGCGSASDPATMSVPEAVLSPDATPTSGQIGDSGSELSSTTVHVTTFPSTSDPTETPSTSTSSLAMPDHVRWLGPPGEVKGLRLVEARRELVAGCGPADDCELTVPSATLQFDTTDLTTSRSLSVYQTLDTGPGFVDDTVPSGDLRSVGSRDVIVDEQGAPETSDIAAAWSEPDGIAVKLQAVNIPWDDVQSFIASLRPIDAGGWPGIDVHEALGRCVGSRTQYAPAGVPDGWTRFVLDAAPVGTCDVSTFLFLSLVIPGITDKPGTLVTFVSSPASSSMTATGVAVDIKGVTGHLEESLQSDGTPSSSITMQIGDVSIGAHGNVDPDTLVELMETVRLVNDAEWSQLVDEIDVQ